MKNRKVISCQHCGMPINNEKYCGTACQYEAYRERERINGTRIKKSCEWCKSTFEMHRSDVKIHPNKRYCSRNCKDSHQAELYRGTGNPSFGKIITQEQLEIRHKRTLYNSAKRRAKEKGLEFNISLDDIQIPERCPLLGIPLFRNKGVICKNSPSLDRIDPRKGYVIGNVHVISFRANSIKQDATIGELSHLVNNLKTIWPK